VPNARRKRRLDSIVYPVPTLIEFLLDETGSMRGHLNATIGGYNDFLDLQRQRPEPCLLSLTKFDTHGLRTPYIDSDIQCVPDLTEASFLPGAGTNLRDAILARIDALSARLANWDVIPPVLFVVMTDGQDNASNVAPEVVAARVGAATVQGWSCVYLGANGPANQIGTSLGFAAGNIRSFETARMRETMHDLGQATSAFRASGAPTEQFFHPAPAATAGV
jgi:hypothetical protein